ncbi:hypothetical protein ABBQ38_008840 [Trebouxia sp. C0009 RCD-2024]
MAAVELGPAQMFGGSLPTSAAGRFCLPHLSQGSSTDLQSIQHENWSDLQSLDHRSQSFPMGTRDATQASINTSQWPLEQAEQRSASSQSTADTSTHSDEQSPISQGPALHVNSPKPQSAWRRSLDQDQPMIASCDSGISENSSTKKRKTVLVWDLDETLILFHSLLSGAYASHHSPEKANEGHQLGNKWQTSILDVCDQHFFFTQIENFDQTTSTALEQWDDHEDLTHYDFTTDGLHAIDNDDDRRKLAYRFRRISQLYSQGLKPLAQNSMELSNWNWLYNATDKLTKGWLKHGARLLQQVTASAKASPGVSGDDMQRFPSNASTSSWQSVCGDAFGHTMMDQHLTKLMQKTSGVDQWMETDENADVVNVLVTTGQLVPTLGKLLLFKLDGAFKATSVYSARNKGKAHCFDLIAERFGSDCNYVAIGDGSEEQRCAQKRSWPFVKVNLKSKPVVAAKVVGEALAAFPTEGGLLTSIQAEHLTSLWQAS